MGTYMAEAWRSGIELILPVTESWTQCQNVVLSLGPPNPTTILRMIKSVQCVSSTAQCLGVPQGHFYVRSIAS